MKKMTPEQYKAFTIVLDEYTQFLNQQKGMYADACAGFAENKRVIEIEKTRVQQRHQIGTNARGRPVMMFTSLEDPNSPESIQLRIIRADDYIAENSEGGSHEQQHARAILIFIFTFWEDEIRPRTAKALKRDISEVTSDIMGDLRIVRHAILHAKAVIKAKEHKRLKILKDMFNPDEMIVLSHQKMDEIFQLIIQDSVRMLLEFIGTEGQIDPNQIKQIAVQRFDRNSG